MDGLIIVLIVLGVILLLAFAAWFCLTERGSSKETVLMCDTLLIVLSIALLVAGLQLRNRTMEEKRELQMQEMSEQIENGNDIQ